VRAALEFSALDHGPVSVHDKMRALGMTPVPSVASLERIFRRAGVARLEPKKKPRAAYRRFVYPAPNACWQLDATEYVLTGGRKCVIFQLQDDHSRTAVASHVAPGETAQDALRVVEKGIASHGVPQRLLSDNGIALNPTRRGWRTARSLRDIGGTQRHHLRRQRHPPRQTKQVTVSLAYASDSRVHLHSQTAPTSGSSWSSTCSKPSDTRTPVDGFGPGRVCAMT
jgi:hypothetical protein